MTIVFENWGLIPMIDQVMRTRIAPFTIVWAIALTAGAGAAQAHAELRRASPPPGTAVSEAPREVTLIFTETLEAAFSSADVTDSSGVRVDQGKAQVNGDTMHIGLKALSPGSYRVHWRALSADTHRSEGNFTFKVGGQ